ncbi:STAS domain-containing protein [Geodermatophilus saharensis]|uniref:STAS domain-containing protein n=1 Tax=Geodermatophilus saharensis TaxID=1137994 RepID=UPI001C3DAA4E|nr:STAS domain-containing protein [Geodermatophilus saharensis]
MATEPDATPGDALRSILRGPAARRPRGRAPAAASSAHPRPRPASDPPVSEVHVDLVTGRLVMTGRLDVRTTHLLYDAISALLTARHPTWTVDVGGLTHVDDAGVRVLLGAYRRAVRHGRRITLRGASPALRHALTLLRLDRHVLLGEEAAPGDPGAGPGPGGPP